MTSAPTFAKAETTTPMPPCNILLIQADQLAPHALSFHGNKVSKTPHLDGLMREAVVFSKAYCSSPICAPSRFSMLSGRLPTDIGAWDNAAEFSSEVPTLAHVLRARGYHTVLAGKMHFVGADQLHGFEERLTTDVYPGDFGWTPNWDEEQTGKRNPLFFETFLSVAEADWVHSSMQLDFDEEVAFTVKRKLREMGRRTTASLHRGTECRERPFFMIASFTEPHDPYSAPKEFWDQYEGVDIDMPKVPFIPRAERDPLSQRIYDCMDNGDFDITDERIVKARRAYYSMLSFIDSKIGELLATLENEGLRDDTLIVFTSDHGDMQGERGMWFKETYHERATRVPLFFHATPKLCAKYGLELSPGVVNSNVSLVDLMPTLVHLACGANWQDTMPSRSEGRSLMHKLAQPAVNFDGEGEDTIYCEYTSEMVPGGWFMVKRGDLKLVCSDGDPLLFDLAADPLEMVNVAKEGAYTVVLSQMMVLAQAKWPDISGLTERILKSQRDRRLIHKAMTQGKRTFWDHQPPQDVTSSYIRNNGEALQDREYVCRAPYRGKRPRR
eukprot:TRINITY_DN55247_c0_g1_i1.p1 TRINITY_DN55247_c0_g1~~TRINITY_DN55247_c0_g1_i1.p1  ORF type:complete len:555 (-),score=92.42 TRINITY_DN55247_c0_g1_i1:123-1787(-)